MAVEECDYHYLVTTAPRDVVKYSTRLDAVTALHNLMMRHADEGFSSERDESGRHTSAHRDGRSIKFWIEDASGDIVT